MTVLRSAGSGAGTARSERKIEAARVEFGKALVYVALACQTIAVLAAVLVLTPRLPHP